MPLEEGNKMKLYLTVMTALCILLMGIALGVSGKDSSGKITNKPVPATENGCVKELRQLDKKINKSLKKILESNKEAQRALRNWQGVHRRALKAHQQWRRLLKESQEKQKAYKNLIDLKLNKDPETKIFLERRELLNARIRDLQRKKSKKGHKK
jgi:hypothetical protein